MLPVDHLIGHKEWTSRKSDPRYSMNWRRSRVAAFRPRGDDDVTPEELLNAKVSTAEGTVRQTLIDARQIARRAEEAADEAKAAVGQLRIEVNGKLDAILAKLA